ncbi:DUF6571 family protein [Streptomyces avicenniae]|uniref:DUF6571 family protein n=1 Tax=Streptomyces avicenniae TaxID=500153 RepID=UPI00069C0413|nr:DUF6571 family protein [Streptomyces avicenniae]
MARAGLTVETLLNLQLGQVTGAVTDWESQVAKLEELGECAANMVGAARAARWRGENERASVAYIGETSGQLDAALTQARTIAALLRDGHGRLTSCRDALLTVMESDAPAARVHVSTSGEVTADYDGLDGEDRRARQDAVMEIAARIQDVLRRTVEEDALIAQAVREAMGTDPYRFSPVAYGSIDEVNTAIEDARTVLDLADRGQELTDAELAELSRLLADHADDPAFAERIATGLGPEGTVTLWTDITGSRSVERGSELWDTMATLQTNLGNTLGLATQSDSDAMDAWEESMIALGPERVAGDVYEQSAHNFLVMSALMNSGTYDSDFLLAYGDALLDFEQAGDGTAYDVWDAYPEPVFNFPVTEADAGDLGRDPMTGFLTALGNNPDASTRFFSPPSDFVPTDALTEGAVDADTEGAQVNERLHYLTTEREWWLTSEDTLIDMNGLTAHPALGEALLAATTGHPASVYASGDPEALASLPDNRSQETAQITSQVMHLYGTLEPGRLAEQPALAPALGQMTAAYINDVNYWLSDPAEPNREVNGILFEAPYGERLSNGFFGTTRFLSEVAQVPESHEIVSQAEYLYTLGVMSSLDLDSLDAFGQGVTAVETATTVRGLLDQSLVDRLAAEHGADSEAAQQGLAGTAGWTKAGLGALVGAGTAALAISLTGGAAAVAVPLAVGATVPLISEFMNQEVDGAHHFEADSRARQLDEQQFFGAGTQETSNLVNLLTDEGAQRGLAMEDMTLRTGEAADAYVRGQAFATNHGN